MLVQWSELIICSQKQILDVIFLFLGGKKPERSYDRKQQCVHAKRDWCEPTKNQNQGPAAVVNLISQGAKKAEGDFSTDASEPVPSQSLHLSLSARTRRWHREKHPSVNREERMSATEETNVRLHASVDGFLVPDFLFFFCHQQPWWVRIWCPVWGSQIGDLPVKG